MRKVIAVIIVPVLLFACGGNNKKADDSILKKEKMQAVLDYTQNNTICRQVQLLMYFNELHFSECGHCDVCLQTKTPDLNKLKKKFSELLSGGPLSMETLRRQFRTKKDATWVNALNEMIDEEKVQEKKKLLELKQND